MQIRDQKTKKYVTINWQQFFDKSLAFAKALHVLGVNERTTISFIG
jgi:long-subunit acyl-CoA synthetase (AMP-forming)